MSEYKVVHLGDDIEDPALSSQVSTVTGRKLPTSFIYDCQTFEKPEQLHRRSNKQSRVKLKIEFFIFLPVAPKMQAKSRYENLCTCLLVLMIRKLLQHDVMASNGIDFSCAPVWNG